MKFNAFILIICTAPLINSSSLDIRNSCNCSQLIYFNDCIAGCSDCSWNSYTNQCIEIACSDLELSNHCLLSSQRCYWFNKRCKNFTSCEAIPGKDQSECISANLYCPASNGINCLSMEYQEKCSDIRDPDICNNYYSSNGKCMWNGQNCIILKSCTDLWTNSTKSCLQNGCYFDSLSYSCRDMTCSRHELQSSCELGAPTIGPYLNNIIPCKWDTNNGMCKDAKPEDYNVDQCYSYSARTYHWSNSKSSKGKCVPCKSSIFSFILVSVLTIII
ncbi:unnamed protein product [Paramecium pentaurelia]|uniref:Uncharacterized protein n=1 Tax=Paramecium pentaurelia TaxID=43138 RepID=A0A8S1XT14_9CILI|nr:unnamed protein product [Paramecium pentaurelia]